jgi:P pilus assembly chaperone PapD
MERVMRGLIFSGVVRSALIAASAFLMPQPIAAQGAGDLLVAPTRLELQGFRGKEIVLNNIGAETATYRISVELRRMTPDGQLVEVDPAQASEAEKLAQEMIVFAPKRVTLEPNQPQSIRVGVRPPATLPDGEYRVHLLFRAIPKPKPVTEAKTDVGGIAIELRPIYGITIPVFVRNGQLAAQAGISNVHLVTAEGKQGVALDLTRAGNRSVFGDIKVFKPGQADPVIVGRGFAVYPEVDHRSVILTAPEGFTGSLAGPVKIQYVERDDEMLGKVLAETEVTLR